VRQRPLRAAARLIRGCARAAGCYPARPFTKPFQESSMGKGDRKTRKGKTYIRSYGNARPHGVKSSGGAAKPAVKKAAPAK